MEKNYEYKHERLIQISIVHNEECKEIEPIANNNNYQYIFPSAAVCYPSEPNEIDCNPIQPVSCKEVVTAQSSSPNENTTGQMYKNYYLREAKEDHEVKEISNPSIANHARGEDRER